MANRLIGVDIGPRTVRVAVLVLSRKLVTVLALEQRPYADPAELPGLLKELVPGGIQLADRVVTALPAGEAYARRLQFPFRERRKILAAIPFELASHLPIALDDYHVVTLKSRELADGASVTAAAVARDTLDGRLALFDDNLIPLHILDLLPHALAAGVGEAIGSGLLACLMERELLLVCLQGGQLADYRHFPLSGEEAADQLVAHLLAGIAPFRNRIDREAGTLLLTGALATPELVGLAAQAGIPAELFKLAVGPRQIPPPLVPATALAMRAGRAGGENCFNLRQGRYAYRGEAARLKGTLLGMGGLLALSLLLFIVATGLAYREKRREADSLQQTMTRLYGETFPGSAITVDVDLQMQSKLQELRQRAAALGIAAPPQALPILKELAVLVERVPCEIDELTCDQQACTLSGSADSFDSVNRIREQLATATLFARPEVAATRKAIEDGRIEFRLRLPLIVKEAP